MYGLRIIKTIVVCLCLWSASAMAQDSVTLTYQGSLSDAGGQAINGTRAMTFRLYTQAQGGQALWTENHGEADVVDGTFSVVLGRQIAFSPEAVSAPILYLSVQVGDDAEMSPRMRVGGALKAQWAAVAAHARDVRGEDINPASVTVGGQQVINGDGQWVGPNDNLMGPRGPQGERGPLGERGPQGDVGERGSRGDVGPRGDPGPAGERGPQGEAGRVGPAGVEGPQGPPGPRGRSITFFDDADGDGFYDWLEISVGSDPASGDDVPADANFDGIPDELVGPAGPRGPQGTPGGVGPAGPAGAQGVAGEVGQPGPRGDRGERGELGPQGPAGPQGPGGPAGADGAVGPDGAQGNPGPQGAPGPEGALGPAGAQGAQGPAGPGIEIDLDSDDDGFQDWIEVLTGSDPQDGQSQPTDENDDGVADQLVGPIGPAGEQGPDGANGADGQDGGLADFEHINPDVMTSRLVRAFAASQEEMPLVDPQDGNPVESIINVPVSGPLVSVRVTVDIEHADLSQLTMRLRSPRGTIVTLHDGEEGENLNLTYPDDAPGTVEAMAQFVGEGSRGNWTLILTDVQIGNQATVNNWDIEVTYTSSDQLDFVGNIDMHDNTIYNLGEPTTDTHAVNKAYVDAIEARVNELVTQRLEGIRRPTYRWAVWSTYDQQGGWYDGNSGRLFGGVAPSTWSDSNGRADAMSPNKGTLAALFSRAGFASRNGDANVYAESWDDYSSTNSRHAGALFRIRNTTQQPITWTAQYNTTSYSGWSEQASIALNGVNIRSGGDDYASQTKSQNISIPPNRTSTVIFVSGSSQPSGDLRACFLAFHGGSLNLPEGLEFVDDLHTAADGWDN